MTAPKNIIITGASSGLGTALALEYAENGPEKGTENGTENGVVLGLIGRDRDRLAAIATLCRQRGATVETAAINVTDESALTEWLMAFDDRHPVDLVIANAGISAGTGGGGESARQARHIFDVNVNGVINTLLPLAACMSARGKGQLAMVSSIAGFRGSPTAPAYSASKAAVRYYGQALRGQLAPAGVRVSVICPGFIKTPMTAVNRFPMPFLMSADKAARLIRRRLAKGCAKITFPLPMALLACLQSVLPDVWINRLYRAVPAKPSE